MSVPPGRAPGPGSGGRSHGRDSGGFHSVAAEHQKPTVLSSKTRNTIKVIDDSNAGILAAKDNYGTRLECVYGTLAPTGRPGGVCEDTQGNRYKLFFD